MTARRQGERLVLPKYQPGLRSDRPRVVQISRGSRDWKPGLSKQNSRDDKNNARLSGKVTVSKVNVLLEVALEARIGLRNQG